MLSTVPIPTDNIYKFCALSSVLALLTTLVMFFIRNDYYNMRAFERYAPIEDLKAQEELTPKEKRLLFWLEEQARIDGDRKDVELGFYLIIFFSGIGFTSYGFYQWHTKIQPQQDRLLDIQIRKLELESRKLELELEAWAVQQTNSKRM